MLDLSLPITTLLASSLALWLLVLSWTVVRARRAGSVSLGDGENKSLQRKIRAQGNLTEYAPLFVIIIALAELQSGNSIVISALAILFVTGRILHGAALAFTQKSSKGRIVGMALTFGSIGIAAAHGLILVVT